MRTPLALLALVCFSGGLTDPEEKEDSGPGGDPRRYGRLVFLPEDSVVPDASEASGFFFPELHKESSCGNADAEGASWNLEPSKGLGRVASSTSGPSSAGRPR